MFRVHRYVLRQVMVPLLITLGVAALLLLLERMLRVFDFVINEGGPFDVVWRMLGNLAPQYLSLALPIGLFLGIQLGIRKLSLNSELDALQSGGIGLGQLLPPLFGLGVVLMLFSLVLSGYIQPYSRYAYANLVFEVQSGTLGASIRAGEFTNIGNGVTLRIDGSRNNGRTLDRIFIEKESADGHISALTARQGSFFTTQDLSSLVLRLEDGVMIDLDFKKRKPQVLTFKSHDFAINLPQAEEFRGRGDHMLEQTLPELWRDMHSTGDAKEAVEARASFHARVVRGVTLLIIPLFALPLGMVAKRSTGTPALAFGIIVMLIVHKLLEFGEVYASLGRASVWLTLWLPIVLFLILSLRLFYLAAFKVGGAPLGRIEQAWNAVAALFAALRRRPEA